MMISIILFALVVTYVVSISYDCDTRGDPESERYWKGNYKADVLPCELKEIDIPENYTRYEDPENPNHMIGVKIERVEFLENVEKCNVTVEATVEWMDRRLQFAENATTKGWRRIPLSVIYYVWRPGSYIYLYDHNIVNTFYGLDYPNEGIHRLSLYADETADYVKFYVRYRKSFIIQSTVGYMYYPHDKHKCPVFVEYDVEGTLLSFNNKRHLHPSFKINVTTQSHKPDFDEKWNHTAYMIVLTRKSQSYIIRSYLPSGLFVMLSWLSMLVPVELATERVALCTATLLTLTTFFNTASLLGPEVSYLRASDIWLLGCIFFVFIILFENIAVMKVTGRFTKLLPKPAGEQPKLENVFANIRQLQLGVVNYSEGAGDTGILSVQQEAATTVNKPESGIGNEIAGVMIESDSPKEKFAVAQKVDRVTSSVVTVGMIICNVIYWIWLLTSEQTSCELDSNCSDEL